MSTRNSHCSYCGARYGPALPWPRHCAGCRSISYLNPLPVAVVLLPVDAGLLCVRRAIEPGKGKLALPGGFIDIGETWQEAAARELWEETGIRIDAAEVRDFQTRSSPTGDGILVVFGLANARTAEELPAFQPSAETSEGIVIQAPTELAFPLHTEAVRAYFAAR